MWNELNSELISYRGELTFQLTKICFSSLFVFQAEFHVPKCLLMLSWRGGGGRKKKSRIHHTWVNLLITKTCKCLPHENEMFSSINVFCFLPV